jgi:hypothetical protein
MAYFRGCGPPREGSDVREFRAQQGETVLPDLVWWGGLGGISGFEPIRTSWVGSPSRSARHTQIAEKEMVSAGEIWTDKSGD